MAAEATQVQVEPQSSRTATEPAAASSPAQPETSGTAAAKKSKGKDKDSKRSKDAAAKSDGPSVAAHPRAAHAVASAKGWGGLAGFLIAGYFSLPTSTLADAALRALVAGSVCYIAAWAAAVFIWRRLVMLEIKGREQQLLEGLEPVGERQASPSPPAGARANPRTAS
jgi:hypothetical protein